MKAIHPYHPTVFTSFLPISSWKSCLCLLQSLPSHYFPKAPTYIRFWLLFSTKLLLSRLPVASRLVHSTSSLHISSLGACPGVIRSSWLCLLLAYRTSQAAGFPSEASYPFSVLSMWCLFFSLLCFFFSEHPKIKVSSRNSTDTHFLGEFVQFHGFKYYRSMQMCS